MVKISKDLVKLFFLKKRRVLKEYYAKLGVLVSDKKNGVLNGARFLRKERNYSCEYFPMISSREIAKVTSNIVKTGKVIRGLVLLHALVRGNSSYDDIGSAYWKAIEDLGMDADGFLFLICGNDELFAFVREGYNNKEVKLVYV